MNAIPIANIELPETEPGIINRVVSLEDARTEKQPKGVKFWLSRESAHQYAGVSPAQLQIMEFRCRIETYRAILSKEQTQVRLFVSRDSLDAYRKNFGKEAEGK